MTDSDELDLAYEQLDEARRHAAGLEKDNEALRNALAGLYGLCKLIYVGADPSDEIGSCALIRRVLATNHRSIEAARVLGCDRLDDPARERKHGNQVS